MKTFVARFDLLDNFTAKFDALQKKINAITDNRYTIGFDIDSGALQQTQELGKKLQESTAGITKTTENATVATKKHAETQKTAGKSVEQHTSATQKAGSAIDALKTKYEGITDSVQKFTGSLAAMATGGAIAGLSYISAAQSNLEVEDTIKAIAGNRKNLVSEEQIRQYVKSFSGSGWTSTSKIAETVETAYLYGGKLARGQRGLDQAAAAEKVAFANQESLGGMTGADLMRLAALYKDELRPSMEAEFRKATAEVAGTAGYEGMIKTAKGRLKLLEREAETIDIKVAMDERPWAVAQQNISDLRKAVGESIAGPMSTISKHVAGIAKSMKEVPGFAKILGWVAILITLAGAASMLIGIFTPLASAIMGVSGATSIATLASKAFGVNMLTTGSKLASFTSLLLSPYTILFALAAIILVVAYKTGVLSAAWDKFTKSAMGGDILSSIAAIADVIGLVIDKFSEWYEASGRSQLLSYFMFLVEVLGNAYDFMDKIYGMTKSTTGNPLLAGIIALASTPLALYAGGVKASTGVDVSDLLGAILRLASGRITPFLSKIHEVLKKALSLFEWLYGLFQSFWSWIKTAMPGAEKEAARKQYIQTATKEGVYYSSGDWFKLDETGKKTGMRANEFGIKPSAKLLQQYETYQELPGFAEEIADAVKRGLIDFADTIKTAMIDALKDIPGMDLLMEAIENLQTAIEDLKRWIAENVPSGNPVMAFLGDAKDTAVESLTNPGGPVGAAVDTVFGSHASGATFTRSGYFRGNVHAPEEIIPQATASKGPGPISRALEALDSAGLGGTSAGNAYEVHIHNENKFDFAGAKLDAGFDLNKLMKEIDTRIERGSVKAVLDALGQRRT